MKAHEDFLAWPILELHLQTLQRAANNNDVVAIRAVLHTCVHGYGEQIFPSA